MANDISNINSSKPKQATDKGQATHSTDTTDNICLTDTAKKLKILEKQLSQESPVNEQKVAHVRAALQHGNYQVDPEKIAEKMLDFESKLDD